jgi:hypothetical protein
MSELAPPAAPQEHRYPCDQCGSDYRFAPGEAALICDHCGHRDPISSGPWGRATLTELDFDAAVASKLPEAEIEELRVLTCPNCAAQIATPVVTDTGTHRYIKPRGVLPFALDERTAHKAMSDWLGKLWFAPNGLQEYARKGRKMQGIYAPYWTYDADTKSSYRGEHGTVYYETRTVTRDGKTSTEQVPKVRWRPASGRVARFFDDILVLASRSLPKKYTDGLSPWDLSALEPYQPQYLAGLRAEGYTIELVDGYKEARQHMANVIERDVRFDIGGDRQRIHDIDTSISDVTFKHILLPVWLAAYKYRGTTYRFVVNGQSGRVQGERPWSAIKITIAVTLGLLVAAGIGYVIAINQ